MAELGQAQLKLRFGFTSVDLYQIDEVGWKLTFEVVDTLTGSVTKDVRPFEEQPHELCRKWNVYTGNGIIILIIYIYVLGPLRSLLEEIQQITLIHL